VISIGKSCGLLFLAVYFVLSVAPMSAVAQETCPISPSPEAPSWCSFGLGGQFFSVVQQAGKIETPLPVNYRLCMSKPNGPPAERSTAVYYGIGTDASSPLPQTVTIQPGQCFCAASTAGLQVASQTPHIVGGTVELLPSGTFSTNGVCNPPERPVLNNSVTLSPPVMVSAECISYYGGTPYHQGRCEISDRAKPGNYRLCFPSDYSFPSGHDPASFAGNYTKLFLDSHYMETNEDQYDARRSSVTTTCMDIYGARTIQATIFEPQPNYTPPYLPPPMHGSVKFDFYWKSDDVKRIKVYVQKIITR
jgi:hypothetical protein